MKCEMRGDAGIDEEALLALERLTTRLTEFGEPKHRVGKVTLVKEDENDLECKCCLMPIEKGDMFMTMACCGAVCHVQCMAKVANSHPLLMSHACPNCVKRLTKDEEAMLTDAWGVLKTFQKTSDDEGAA